MASASAGNPDGKAIQDMLEPAVSALGLDLEAVDVVRSGRRRRVSVIIDRDAGIDLDLIAEASRAVSDVLDGSDAMGDDPYTLEVTSPGVDRPLTQERHWRRNRGRLVDAHLRDGSRVQGRIAEVGDTGVTLSPGGGPVTEAGAVPVPWGDLDHGLIQIEFRRLESEEE